MESTLILTQLLSLISIIFISWRDHKLSSRITLIESKFEAIKNSTQHGFAHAYIMLAIALLSALATAIVHFSSSAGVTALSQQSKTYSMYLDAIAAEIGNTSISIVTGQSPGGVALVAANGLIQGTYGNFFVGVAYALPAVKSSLTITGNGSYSVVTNTNALSYGTYVKLSDVKPDICIAHAIRGNYSIQSIGTATLVSGLPSGAAPQSMYSVAWPTVGCILNGTSYDFITKIM